MLSLKTEVEGRQEQNYRMQDKRKKIDLKLDQLINSKMNIKMKRVTKLYSNTDKCIHACRVN